MPMKMDTSQELKEYEARIEELRSSEKLLAELNETLEMKLKKTEALRAQREQELRGMGIALHADGVLTGVFAPKTPNLVNLNEDPTMSECLIYYLKQDHTTLGHLNDGDHLDIGLLGSFIKPHHCNFILKNNIVYIEPIKEAECYINGSLISKTTELHSGDRVILGKNHVFRFNNPLTRSMSEAVDWTYAICELLDKQGVDLRKEMDERLLEMEEQYRRERAEIDRKFDEQRREYEGQIQFLQEKVDQQSTLSSMVQEGSVSEEETDTIWSDRNFQLARWVFQNWKHCRFTTRRDILWNNAVLLKEANVMSVELNKKMEYQFVMLSDTPYTPLKDELAEKRKSLSDGAAKTLYPITDPLDTRGLVAVEAHNTLSGVRYRWSLQMFHQRLIDMQKLFNAEGDLLTCNFNNRSLDHGNGENAAASDEKVKDDTEKEEGDYATTNDPFFDKLPWFQPIGRCLVYLTNLFFNISQELELPLINRSGERMGVIRILIESSNDSSPPRSPNPSPLFAPASQGGRRKGHTKLLFNDLEYFTAEAEGLAYNEDYAFGRFEPRTQTDSLVKAKPAVKSVDGETPKIREGRFFPADSTTSEGDVVSEASARRPWLDEEILPSHLRIGETFWWKVTVLFVHDLPPHFASVFCQFSLPDRPDDIYSTESVEIKEGTTSLDFFQVQKFSVTVTRAFVDCIVRKPLLVEAFGHPRKISALAQVKNGSSGPTPTRSSLSLRKGLSATLLTPPPVPFQNYYLTNSSHPRSLICQNDLLVWFEIQELNDAGEYTAVPVQRSNDSPGQGVFMLHQGVQRRFAVTIIHDGALEGSPELEFIDLPKVVVGRARDTPVFHLSDDQTRILSLSVFPVNYLPPAGDDRNFYRFEAAWDSSLHGCSCLNRATPKGHSVYLTMSCYLQLSCCLDPICITKDFAMVIFPRSSPITVPRPIRSLIGSLLNQADLRHVTGIYDLQFWNMPNQEVRTTPRHLPHSTYVRGEENIRGWRPRSDSLILEHQVELERLSFIEAVEKTKQFLRLRELLKAKKLEQSLQRLDEMISLLQGGHSYDLFTQVERLGLSNKSTIESMSDAESTEGVKSHHKPLLRTCTTILGFIKDSRTFDLASSPVEGAVNDDADSDSSMTVSERSQLCSSFVDDSTAAPAKISTDASFLQCGEVQHDMVCARCDEVRISPVVNRRGQLLIADESNPIWSPKWVTIRRPFLYICENDKDTLERRIINLKSTKLEYSADESEIFGPTSEGTESQKPEDACKHPMIFALKYGCRKVFMKTHPNAGKNEVHEWLYAIDPLMAGEIKSRLGRRKN